MKLADQALHSGRLLFRWRSYVPLLFLPVIALAFLDHGAAAAGRTGWQLICLAVALAGLAIRVYTVGHAAAHTSGRNQATQVAGSLNTTGMYSIVRHPLYLGNALMYVGAALLTATWYAPVIVALGTALYYEKIMLVEEAFLEEKYGDQFRAWATRTPAILPAPALWQPAALPFAWRTAFRGEIYGAFAVVLIWLLADAFAAWRAGLGFRPGPVWAWAAVVIGVVWLLARFARKHTSLLTAGGR